MVTWQTKSENIYFEGEKSTALEEQVKAHIESKHESGNAELMSDSEQQQQSDLKRDEDLSHKECSTYANSPNATLLGRPSTFDNPQIAETKDSFNSRGSANKAYTNYSTYDPEIIMLKSKFEKCNDNVVTRLDELAFK